MEDMDGLLMFILLLGKHRNLNQGSWPYSGPYTQNLRTLQVPKQQAFFEMPSAEF
jgi:hypothetical protein